MLIRKIIAMSCLVFFCANSFAQNTSRGDLHVTNQNMIIRIEDKGDNEASSGTIIPAYVNENVSFTTTSEGIYITILSGSNKIRLLALTGQLLLAGDLTQGRFFIPTRKGIYFLKINNKNYRIICK